MSVIKGSVLDRLKLAYGQDSSIVAYQDELSEHRGNTAEYLDQLGLSEADLKHLERHGLAMRGYLPSGKGSRLRWLIIIPKIHNTEESNCMSNYYEKKEE